MWCAARAANDRFADAVTLDCDGAKVFKLNDVVGYVFSSTEVNHTEVLVVSKVDKIFENRINV